MTTIYKAIPNQSEVTISCLDESLRFIGNDVKKLTIDNVQYGRSIILEEIDSLEEIIVKKPGAIFAFNSFPTKTIRISGSFEEVRVKDGNSHYCIHRFGSDPTLPMETLWGAVISQDDKVKCEKMDALILKSTSASQLDITDELSHISIIGDKHLQQINVSGKRIIKKLTVHQGPALTTLNIRRRVLSCSLQKCPFVDTVIGLGDRLSIHPRPRKKNTLSIGGFWHEVPEWYDLQVALLQVPHFNAHLSARDIITCDDMSGVAIKPYRYQGRGSQLEFSEILEMDIEEVCQGIELSRFIKIVESKPKSIQVLESWIHGELSWFDQYKAMRVIASLIARGFDKSLVIDLRNRIAQMNCSMPKLANGSVNDSDNGGTWMPLYSEDSGEWEVPNNSVMPFGRVDLEIWLNTDLGIEFLGMDSSTKQFQTQFIRRKHLGENRVVRNLLIATLSAANTAGRNTDAERKLTELAQSLYTNPIINTNPFCCEFTVYHLTVSRVATKPIVNELIQGIMSMNAQAWKKAALLVGIVDITNSTKARMALKRLAADKGLSLSESTRLNAISIVGSKAFESGKAVKPVWPYLINWPREN